MHKHTKQNSNNVYYMNKDVLNHLVAVEDIFFAQCFHGIKCTGVHFTRKTHFTKGTYAQSLDFDKHGLVHFGTA